VINKFGRFTFIALNITHLFVEHLKALDLLQAFDESADWPLL